MSRRRFISLLLFCSHSRTRALSTPPLSPNTRAHGMMHDIDMSVLATLVQWIGRNVSPGVPQSTKQLLHSFHLAAHEVHLRGLLF